MVTRMNEKEISKKISYGDFVSFMHRYEKDKEKGRRKIRESKHTACYQYKSVFKKGK